jgi:hypothetical protein
VFHCGANLAWIYILAELLAALLACSIFAFVSGWGPLNPYKSMREFDMTFPEAVRMFLLGKPPWDLIKDELCAVAPLCHAQPA